MIVKKTCRNRFTAFISTARRYNHASPDIIWASVVTQYKVSRCFVTLSIRERESFQSVSEPISLLVGRRHKQWSVNYWAETL